MRSATCLLPAWTPGGGTAATEPPGIGCNKKIEHSGTCAGCCVVALAQAEPGHEIVRVGQVGVRVTPAEVLLRIAVHAARCWRAQLLSSQC